MVGVDLKFIFIWRLNMSTDNVLKNLIDTETIYKTLIESTLAIPWYIDWDSQKYRYIGPQIERLLGWHPHDWQTVQDWADRIHEDDREAVLSKCVAQSLAGIDHEADYRALTADGHYIWVREVVHVLRNEQGVTQALVGFLFDISERKKQEQELEALKKTLEEYSYQDGLTGIANRRLFNELFQREWLSAVREQTDFSMLLLDIDYFKAYNDHYGHIQGDAALQQVAQIVKQSLTRPRDVAARFGGEEFAVILPDTSTKAATEIAQRIMHNIQKARIPHEASQIAPYLTVSVGVKTSQIKEFDERMQFLRGVDEALYRSKKQGRNSIVIDSISV